MKKWLVLFSVLLMFSFVSISYAQDAETGADTDAMVVPEDTSVNDPFVNITTNDISGGFNDGMDLILPPFIGEFFPSFTPPPSPGTETPIIKENGFGVDFGPYLPEFNELTSRSTFMSKYLWYGQKRFGDDGAWTLGTTYGIPDVLAETALEGTKMFFDITTVQPMDSGNEKHKEIHYTLFGVKTINEGEKTETQITTKNIYYDFQEQGSQADGQEVGLGLAWTNLLRGDNQRLVPSYYIGRVWDRDPKGLAAEADKGNVHVFGGDYYLNIDDNTKTDLHVFGNITMLDNISGADSEMSYTTFGTDLDLDFGGGMVITPFVYVVTYSDDSLKSKSNTSEVVGGFSTNFRF